MRNFQGIFDLQAQKNRSKTVPSITRSANQQEYAQNIFYARLTLQFCRVGLP